MNSKTKFVILKYGVYGLLAVVLCVLQNTPGLFALWGVKPMLAAALAIVVAMLEGEFYGGLFGAFAGFLCDLYGSDSTGYTALMLFLCCVAVGLAVQTFMRSTPFNALLFTFASMVVIRGVSFFFTIFLPGYDGAALFFVSSVLPLCLYTALAGLLFYVPILKFHQAMEARTQF